MIHRDPLFEMYNDFINDFCTSELIKNAVVREGEGKLNSITITFEVVDNRCFLSKFFFPRYSRRSLISLFESRSILFMQDIDADVKKFLLGLSDKYTHFKFKEVLRK